jgi:hypothetical protein
MHAASSVDETNSHTLIEQQACLQATEVDPPQHYYCCPLPTLVQPIHA